VNCNKLQELQDRFELVAAEELFRGAFWPDVRPVLEGWREMCGPPINPLAALAESRYVRRVGAERDGELAPVTSYA